MFTKFSFVVFFLKTNVKCQKKEKEESIFLVHIFNLPPPSPSPSLSLLPAPSSPSPSPPLLPLLLLFFLFIYIKTLNKRLFSPKSSACWKESLGTIHAGKKESG